MKKILNYNARHTLWFCEDNFFPKLNPIVSRSHSEKSRKPCLYLFEPMWLFKIRQRLFCFAGKQNCPERNDTTGVLKDTWDIGSDGNRTCSYCGSTHFADLMKICAKVVNDARYGIEGTDKNYKIYVRQPDVRNAGEGAIKFYICHLPEQLSKEDNELFIKARQLTNKRNAEAWEKMKNAKS